MILIICCAIVLILELFFLYKNPRIDKYIFLYFVFSSFLWVIIPSLFVVFDRSNKYSLEFSKEIFIKYAAYEYFLYIILLFFLNLNPTVKLLYYGKRITNNIATYRLFWYFFVFIAILNLLMLLNLDVGYREINDVYYKEKQNTNPIMFFANFGISFFFISVFYLKRNLSKRKIVLTYILLITTIILNVMQGGRMQIIFIFFILIYYILQSSPYKRIKYSIYLSLLLGITIIIIPVIAGIRNSEKLTVSNIIESIDFTSDIESEFLFQLVLKLNSINTGAVLVEMERTHPFLTPYLNSLPAGIPNFFYPGKRPAPGSSNGELSGSPSRIAAYYIMGNSRFANVGISTSARALWQGGYLFYMLNIIILVYWYRYLNSLLLSGCFYAKMLAFYFTLIALFILPTGDLIIAEVVKQPMFYFFFIFLSSLTSLKRYYICS